MAADATVAATAAGAAGPAVIVEDLRVELAAKGKARGTDIIDGVSFTIAPGEVLGLVGESGSGKTTAGLALLAHQRRGAEIAGGRITIGGLDMLSLSKSQRRGARGAKVAYVPQDPGASLNPARRIGAQLLEGLRVHGFGAGEEGRRARIAEVMREVALPDDEAFLRRYPHELSGGQQQRVALAMAFAGRPAVVVLDEPTTGLDVTTQAHVLETVRRMTRLEGTAALYVSHDLSVVASFADRVAVMYAGRLVEEGPVAEIFAAASHPYTRMLLAAVPRIDASRELVAIPGRAPSPGSRPHGCPFAPRCPLREERCEAAMPEARKVGDDHVVRCVRATEARTGIRRPGNVVELPRAARPEPTVAVAGLHASYGDAEVVHGVDLEIGERECVALVGESGSGKTTVAKSIAGLHADWTGTVRLGGEELAASTARRDRGAKREVQYVFQNPYGSLNPRRTVGQTIAQPLKVFGTAKGSEADDRVAVMLERVSLTSAYANRYPDQLSGGERQRVAIARALVCEPTVLICDEVTSALDVSVQAAIVELLGNLQRDLGLSMLFVTHNLPLVRSIAQRVAVMSNGNIVELGEVGQVLSDPTVEYTRQLLSDTPSLEVAAAAADVVIGEPPPDSAGASAR
jgi:peptide/nickel transport system ATP-binding protein